MAVCTKCTGENPEGARFCNSCGSPLTETAPREEQRKTVTVLFCDVTGSTALGERLDPESLRRVMARYFEEARRVIEHHGGTVEKFIGDAVMAVFGVPLLHEDDALRAVRAAHELRACLADLNLELERNFGTTLEIRIGVNTGEVVTVADELLATGDAVNVAARLEQAARPGEILIGQETLQLTRDAVEVENLEPLTLKGKTKPVPAFPLVSVVSGAAPIEHRQDVTMVGRQRELRHLQEIFAKAREDRSCQLFTILGSAGVGKSRLVYEFLSSLDGPTILRSSCLSYGEGITYWPVLEVIRELEPRLSDLLRDDRAAVVIRGLLGQEEETAGSTQEIAWAFRKLLEAGAQDQPVVCVFDDVHWGEESFLDLVEHVADLSRGFPILLLCMARPELLDRRPTWSGGKLNATTILLEPLGASETDVLVDELVADGQLDPSLKSRIRDAAEGNPFFCEQLVALAQESGTQTITVPSTIQSLLAARLDQLDPSERGVLARGSIEGRVFHVGAVQALAPEEPQLVTRLTSLVRRELIRPDQPQLPGEDAFRFRHLLIRDATYDALSKSTRAQLHERFAQWLREHGFDLLELDEILGFHLEQAYRYRSELGPLDESGRRLGLDAGKHLAAAGRRALDRGDIGGSTNLLRRAIDLLRKADRDADIGLALVESLFESGSLEEAAEVAAAEAERSTANADTRGALKARLLLEQIRSSSDPQESTDRLHTLSNQALPQFEAAGDHAGLALVWFALGALENFPCHFAASVVAGQKSLEHARAAHNRRSEREAMGLIGLGLVHGPAPVKEVLRWFEEHEATSHVNPMITPHRSVVLAMSGDFVGARRLAAQSRHQLEELGMTSWLATTRQLTWRIEMLAGDAVAAEREAREGCELLIQMGERGFFSTSACTLAESLLALNRVDEAEEWAERGRQAGASDDIVTQALWRSVRGRILARRGEFLAGMDLMREGLLLVEQTDMLNEHADMLMAYGEVLDLADQRQEAAESRQKALSLYEQKGNVVGAGRARATLQGV